MTQLITPPRTKLWRDAKRFALQKLSEGSSCQSGVESIQDARRVAFYVKNRLGVDAVEVPVVALLREVLENSDAPLSEVFELFDSEIANAAAILTEPMMGPRSLWKNLYLKALVAGPEVSVLIKIADLLRRMDDGEEDIEWDVRSLLAELNLHDGSLAVTRASEILIAAELDAIAASTENSDPVIDVLAGRKRLRPVPAALPAYAVAGVGCSGNYRVIR